MTLRLRCAILGMFLGVALAIGTSGASAQSDPYQ